MDTLARLTDRWRNEAVLFRRYGDERGATICELHANELEAAVGAAQLEAVTLEEAKQIGGYSYSHLQHMVKDGTLENVGKDGAPRIRRSDVPIKPGHQNRHDAERGFIGEVLAQRRGRAP